MGDFIQVADLDPFADIDTAKATAMIEDAEAQAILTAPCLAKLHDAPADETPEQKAQRLAKVAAVKAIVRAAILRWDEAGTGAIQTETTGPFTQSIQQASRRSMFWPVEIESLQRVCKGDDSKAFSVDTIPGASAHLAWCALNFGALYCSCGVSIAGHPIFEGA